MIDPTRGYKRACSDGHRSASSFQQRCMLAKIKRNQGEYHDNFHGIIEISNSEPRHQDVDEAINQAPAQNDVPYPASRANYVPLSLGKAPSPSTTPFYPILMASWSRNFSKVQATPTA